MDGVDNDVVSTLSIWHGLDITEAHLVGSRLALDVGVGHGGIMGSRSGLLRKDG